MSIYQVSWSAAEPVGSAVERLILTRIASQTGGGGRDEPDPCQFVIAVDDHVDHDGVDVDSVLHALVGLQRRGLIVDVRHDGGFVTGALVCPIRLRWVEAERVRVNAELEDARLEVEFSALQLDESEKLLDAALARVATEIGLKSAVLSEELQLVTLELRAGSSKEKALRNLALRTGVDDVDALVAMLIQSERFGTSIADSLRVQSDQLRTKRRQRAEEQAAKIALKLLFPLIFFIFPSLLVVLLGPAFIQIYRVLLPTMSGGN